MGYLGGILLIQMGLVGSCFPRETSCTVKNISAKLVLENGRPLPKFTRPGDKCQEVLMYTFSVNGIKEKFVQEDSRSALNCFVKSGFVYNDTEELLGETNCFKLHSMCTMLRNRASCAQPVSSSHAPPRRGLPCFSVVDPSIRSDSGIIWLLVMWVAVFLSCLCSCAVSQARYREPRPQAENSLSVA